MAARVLVDVATEAAAPVGVVQGPGVADERHPVAHVADVLGLVGGRVDGAAELDVSGGAIAVEGVNAHGGVMALRVVAGDAVALPDEGARVVVHADVLLGQVDVDVAVAPVLETGVGGGLGRALRGNLDGTRGARLDGLLERRRERLLVRHPAVGVIPVVGAGGVDRDRLAIRSRVGARGAAGVVLGRDLGLEPLAELGVVERGVEVLVERDPRGDLGARDLAGRLPVQRERDVCRHEAVGVLGGRRERRVIRGHRGLGEAGVIQRDPAEEATESLAHGLDRGVAVKGRANLLGHDDILLGLVVKGDRGVRGLRGARVVLVDGRPEKLGELVGVKRGAVAALKLVVLGNVKRPGEGMLLRDEGACVGVLVKRQVNILAAHRETEVVAHDLRLEGGDARRLVRGHL